MFTPHRSVSDRGVHESKLLGLAFRGRPGTFHERARECDDRCFSLRPSAPSGYRDLRTQFENRELSFDLGQSGPVSLRFNGRRLKMQLEF
jgi:hypothetical protein